MVRWDEAKRSKLTKRIVDAAEPRAVRYTMFDSDIRGFGLRIFPSGQKSWIFEYKSVEGGRRATTKRVTIGRANEFTPDQARKIADSYRSKAKLGLDPQLEKAKDRAAPTVQEVIGHFLTKHVQPKRKGSTASGYADVLTRILAPALGSKKAHSVTRAQLAKLHLEWSGTPFQANRLLAVVGSMYSFAGKHGLVPDGLNPAKGIERYTEFRRERLLSVVELERLGAAIREAETVGLPWEIDPTKNIKHVPKGEQTSRINEHVAAALRLLIFTGARVGEVLSLNGNTLTSIAGFYCFPSRSPAKKPSF